MNIPYLTGKKLIAICLVLWAGMSTALAELRKEVFGEEEHIALYYSDDSTPTFGIDGVNRKLREVGVRVSQIKIPEDAKPIFRASKDRAIMRTESAQLIQLFKLGRRELVDQIAAAGRQPERHRDGYLQTSEAEVAPYPKV